MDADTFCTNFTFKATHILSPPVQFDRELSSANAASNARYQAVQNQLQEEKESYELKLMMTASDAMERDNKNERQIKELAKKNEELQQKLALAAQASASASTQRQLMNSTPASEVHDGHDGTTLTMPTTRQQFPVAGFSQKNLLRSAPQAPQPKRPRSDFSQQPMPQNLRGSSVLPMAAESSVAPRSQTQGGLVATTSGTPETNTPASIDAIRDLVRLGSHSLQQCSVSPEMRFIQQCLHNGPTSPFKQLSQALSESGALGESEALMHGAELLSSMCLPLRLSQTLFICACCFIPHLCSALLMLCLVAPPCCHLPTPCLLGHSAHFYLFAVLHFAASSYFQALLLVPSCRASLFPPLSTKMRTYPIRLRANHCRLFLKLLTLSSNEIQMLPA